jgi:tRNA (mo5U34)-methyltransferase
MDVAARSLDQGETGTLRDRIEALAPWFHNIELGGIKTAPDHFLGDYPATKFSRFAHALPADLSGRSVLDIGCNAGFYSVEMKRRGAERVVGIDSDDRYLAQARLATEALGFTGVEFHKLSVYDVAALGERFDLVIFMGVLYHLRHPLLALDLIREHVAGDLMLFQTMQRGSNDVADVPADHPFFAPDSFDPPAIFDEPGYPRMHFIEREYAHDWTNWWAPNRACSEAMLRSAGFTIEAHPEDEVYLCRVTDIPYAKWGSPAVYPANTNKGELRR